MKFSLKGAANDANVTKYVVKRICLSLSTRLNTAWRLLFEKGTPVVLEWRKLRVSVTRSVIFLSQSNNASPEMSTRPSFLPRSKLVELSHRENHQLFSRIYKENDTKCNECKKQKILHVNLRCILQPHFLLYYLLQVASSIHIVPQIAQAYECTKVPIFSLITDQMLFSKLFVGKLRNNSCKIVIVEKHRRFY